MDKYKNKIKLLISDFDRTLVELYSDNMLLELLEELRKIYISYGISEVTLAQYENPYELWSSIYKYINENYNTFLATKIQLIATSVITDFEIKASKKACLLTGVLDTLMWLSVMKIKCVIVSTNSKEAIHYFLRKNDMSNLITEVYGRDNDLAMEDLKPSPTLIQRAIANNGSIPESTMYIGDSKEDMVAGNSAGIPVIGVITGNSTAEELISSGAHIVLSNFSSLEELNHLFNANNVIN